jgi:hypothetical protein
VIHLELIDPSELPAELAVSAVTMAELTVGPHATADPAERARRQDPLQRAEATFVRSQSMPPRLARTAACSPLSQLRAASAAAEHLTCSSRPPPSQQACRSIREIL